MFFGVFLFFLLFSFQDDISVVSFMRPLRGLEPPFAFGLSHWLIGCSICGSCGSACVSHSMGSMGTCFWLLLCYFNND
uniref:Putative secreted protein n=1 Tax=Anopheles marajoara TaxID=58244 RepID=A0A2M4CC77_9DIPT